MDNEAAMLLNPSSITHTDLFLYTLKSWGKEFCASNPNYIEFLSQINVMVIMHNKMPQLPQHEFLVIETKDRLGRVTPVILERTVAHTQSRDDSANKAIPSNGFV